jgi:DNA-binding SARP family transcriptional activator
MHPALVHFLNHGLLPFVGRTEQVEQIERFWRQTADAYGLRALLLVGEAGVGKSRLVEEVIPRISIAGGAVIHAKLYPDSTTSVAPLFARALGRSSAAHALLKSEPEETLSGVIAALVRICSLRPTLLVIEDIHLLQGDALREFASLLDRLSDEPLSLVCAARPVELAARGTLERYLVEEIELGGLTSEEIGELCRQVFDQDVGAELAATLEEKTCGNALALRSALRGALKPGTPPGARAGRNAPAWGKVDRAKLAEALERNVRLLSEGMAAHLNEEEKAAAEQVAALGEVFARESAMALLAPPERAERILSQLLFKGIITTAISTTNPLDRHRSLYPPLSFTHSLLHRHFIEQGTPDPAMLLHVIADDLPLYSVIPFQQLAELVPRPEAGAELQRKVFERALEMGQTLRTGADWKFEETVLSAARRILETCSAEWGEEDRALMQVRLAQAWGYVVRHTLPLFELRNYCVDLLEMASDERFESLRIYRLHALRRLYWFESFYRFDPRVEPHEMHLRLEELRAFVGRFPELKPTREYIDSLCDMAIIAARGDGAIRIPAIERDYEELIGIPELDPKLVAYARVMITPHFLGSYETPDELDARVRMLAELGEDVSADDDPIYDNFVFPHLNFLMETLRIDELLEATEAALQRARLRSTWSRIVPYRMIQMYARLMIDLDYEAASRASVDILSMIPAHAGREVGYTTQVAGYLCTAGILAHDDAAVVAALERFPYDSERMTPLFAQYFALASGSLDEATAQLEPADDIQRVARDLARVVLGEKDADRDAVLRSAIVTLDRPILNTDSLMTHSHLLRLLGMIPESDGNGKMGSAVSKAIRKGTAVELDYLLERNLHKLMLPLLEKFGRFLTKAELATWKSRYTEILKRRGEDRDVDTGQEKIDVTMFGAVTIQQPGGEPERVKGAQLCTLLGLMVADSLQQTPLSQREFMALAIGSDRDPDSARKSLNFAVFRLRELLGSSAAIETAGETPRLARDLVAVDFIAASEALERAAEALQERALMRAVPDLLEALRRSGGQVAYPALYEEFFEAAREDFETTLRRVTLGVARALIREGDSASAEEVLTRSYEAMADDEELGELLQQVLVRQGKRARAARISLRVAEGEGVRGR